MPGDFDEAVSDRPKKLFRYPLTDFEIFGIVDIGKIRSDDERKTEKSAQLLFMTSMKKSELKSSEMEIAPEGRW